MADSQNVQSATDGNFESDILKADQLAVVDFSATWCGPCQMLAPTIDTLADEYAGKVKVFKMDVDENPQTPAKFHVRGVPTVIFFKGGEVVDQFVGNQPKDSIKEMIDRHI